MADQRYISVDATAATPAAGREDCWKRQLESKLYPPQSQLGVEWVL
jgi:hypothetical protein